MGIRSLRRASFALALFSFCLAIQFDLGPMRPGQYEVHATANFGSGIPTRSSGGVTTSALDDNAPTVTVQDGQSVNLDPLTYTGPPPGPVPSWYDRSFPRGLR